VRRPGSQVTVLGWLLMLHHAVRAATELEAARLMVYNAARLKDAGELPVTYADLARDVSAGSRILLDDYTDKLDDEGKRLLKVVRDNTSRMGQLIDDILQFSRMGRQDLSLAPVDMERLVRAVFNELQPLVAGRDVRLQVRPLPAVLADAALLRQVLINLLSNAIKFTPTAGQVWVDLAQETSWVRITVKDSGPGIPEEQLSRIFERFYQADPARTRDAGQGAGLGLSITAWIVEAHGGLLSVENRIDGHGCCFSLRLPHQY